MNTYETEEEKMGKNIQVFTVYILPKQFYYSIFVSAVLKQKVICVSFN